MMRSIQFLAICLIYAAVISTAFGQDDPAVTPEQIKQAEEVMKKTQDMGPWENQTQVIEDATDKIFEQQGWNSESDQFTRTVMRDISKIPPWKPVERQEVFLDAFSERFGLTHDQRTQFGNDLQREGMTLTIKHFKDIIPVALDAAQTRAKQEPFTAEQVQEWSYRLKPLMDDGLDSVQRVANRLEKTMTPEQRDKLRTDMQSFIRRHHDVDKMMDNWKAGKWTPSDFGLQNDPIHAGAMAAVAADSAVKNELVATAELRSPPDEKKIASDESAWDKYVKWFCRTYQCTPTQRGQAESILKNAKSEAIRYRSSRRERIEKAQRAVATAMSLERRTAANTELENQLKPISERFEQMKKSLYEGLLTTQQRQLLPQESKREQASAKAVGR
jgi:hypothetical protein